MDDPHAAQFHAVAGAILETPGELDPEVRAAIATASQSDVPADLRAYVDKVGRHAYKVVDRDIAELKAAGYSEDAIFEATLASALGAARSRLERGLAAVEGLD